MMSSEEILYALYLRDTAAQRKCKVLDRTNFPSLGQDETRLDGKSHLLIVKRNIRKVCKYSVCKTKCQTYCEKCDVALCTDHFKAYHTET